MVYMQNRERVINPAPCRTSSAKLFLWQNKDVQSLIQRLLVHSAPPTD
jgi:hypothetical protein